MKIKKEMSLKEAQDCALKSLSLALKALQKESCDVEITIHDVPEDMVTVRMYCRSTTVTVETYIDDAKDFFNWS